MEQQPTTTAKPSLKQRWKDLLAEYGRIALWTYLTIFAVVLTGFAIAIRSGVAVEGATGQTGLLVAAWAATKVTQPIRILATLALTPLVAQVIHRIRPPTPSA